MCRLARCADFFFFCVISYVRLNSTCSGNYNTALPTHHPRMDAKQVSLVSSRTNKDNKKKVDASGLDDDDDDSNQLSIWGCGGILTRYDTLQINRKALNSSVPPVELCY